MHTQKKINRLPPWFKIRLATNQNSTEVRTLIRTNNLHTVCQSAACPNKTECWNSRTATFMILGDICTRNCGFCNISKGMPSDLDIQEPARIAAAAASLQLKYIVITSVTRDDLPDGGASLFAETVSVIRTENPESRVEVLTPDFKGSKESIQTVLDAKPFVFGHNLETVPSLYSKVRPQAEYRRSLNVLALASGYSSATKTGIMLGLGEGMDEIEEVMRDLREVGCSILTIGQYLQPSRKHIRVKKYYHPDEFKILHEKALCLGFEYVAAGPLVRSSYQADKYSTMHANNTNFTVAK